MTTFKRVTSKPFRMLALRLTFSIAGSYGMLMSGTASSLMAQAPCDSCDGIPVRIAAPAPTRCTSCGHHSPSLADRLLGKLDHIGNSIERSIGSLPRAKCSSCSTKNGCDYEPTCGTEPACGVEASYGIDAAHVHSSNCGCANATTTIHGSPTLAKPFKSSTVPVPPPPQSTREGKPAHQRSPSEFAPPLPTPMAPTPEDWQHDPFQDDTRKPSTLNRYQSSAPVRKSNYNYSRAFDPQAFIQKQKRDDLAQSNQRANESAPIKPNRPIQRSLADSTESQEELVVTASDVRRKDAPASQAVVKEATYDVTFDVTQRVPNRIRRNLSDAVPATARESQEADKVQPAAADESKPKPKTNVKVSKEPERATETTDQEPAHRPSSLLPLSKLPKLKPLKEIPFLR